MLHSFLLGIVQGIAEFLPISSSAHLILYAHFFLTKPLSMGFNVGLHLGTTLAIVMYFYRDWIGYLSELKDSVRNRSVLKTTISKLAIATIPAALVGLLFDHKIEYYFHGDLKLIAASLIIIGVALVGYDRLCKSNLKIPQLSLVNYLVVGLFQVFALVPGVSRSGITIIGGRFVGLSRDEAAKFSFLLGTPAMLGASLLKSSDLLSLFWTNEFLMGFFVSMIVGLIAIHFFLKVVKSLGFEIFAVYRIALAIFILCWMVK